jgi:transposase
VVLEPGPLSAFLYHGLIERAVPAVCICARHAKGVLSVHVNKSDMHDAEGLAALMNCVRLNSGNSPSKTRCGEFQRSR